MNNNIGRKKHLPCHLDLKQASSALLKNNGILGYRARLFRTLVLRDIEKIKRSGPSLPLIKTKFLGEVGGAYHLFILCL